MVLLRFICVMLVLEIRILVAAEHGNEQAAYRDYFYVGGEYVTELTTGENFMKNQMYVERLSTSRKPTQPYPLVLIHGKSMSGANTWLNTPDGRPGWASSFLRHGYVVYLVDQPTRGRSAWQPGDFTMDTFSVEFVEQRFTVPERDNLWPQSASHTQWPGNGTKGDAIFDAFFASTLQFLSNDTETQIKTRDAVVALLDIIGAAILVTHSQSGAHGWLVADARPGLVKAIVALEPVGPPFQDAVFSTAAARAWGVTDIPMSFKPAVATPEQIAKFRIPSNQSNYRVDCILQAEPARSLPNLKSIPVLIGTGEASQHATYDYCSVAFLRQAGVPVEHLPLESIGLHGNGHLMMLESNNLAIAEALHHWIRKKT